LRNPLEVRVQERSFRLALGIALLAGLYFDLHAVLRGVLALLVFEGVTNWRMPCVLARIAGQAADRCAPLESPFRPLFAIPFEAERLLRLVVAGLLAVSLFAWPRALWFVPWFVGFALIGAGLSGICPLVLGLKKFGFR
jgi:hypothetical protein